MNPYGLLGRHWEPGRWERCASTDYGARKVAGMWRRPVLGCVPATVRVLQLLRCPRYQRPTSHAAATRPRSGWDRRGTTVLSWGPEGSGL